MVLNDSHRHEGGFRFFDIKWDSSVLFLIFANIFAILIFFVQKWDFSNLLFLYWFQSVVIGVFYSIKIFTLKNFSAKNISINGKCLESNSKGKFSAGLFFLLHYGILHIGYLKFLSGTLWFDVKFDFFMFLSMFLFFGNHLFSFIKNSNNDYSKIKDLGKIFYAPYMRVIPMNFILWVGFLWIDSWIIAVFLMLKIVSDVLMHNLDHQH